MTMQPRERIPFSAIVDRPPLKLPGGARVIVWTIVNLEVWDIAKPMARQVLRSNPGSAARRRRTRALSGFANAAAVPRVASSVNPKSSRSRAISTAASLSRSRTLINALPPVGKRVPAANCDLTKASPKLRPTPITSPVDFISGPRMVSTPGNFANGKTASLTEK